jgi:hypothetical protein
MQIVIFGGPSPGSWIPHAGAKRSGMQNGSLIQSKWQNGQQVLEFRWRDRTGGKSIYRRIVLGTSKKFATENDVRAAVAGIVLEINLPDPRLNRRALTLSQLAEHYRLRELSIIVHSGPGESRSKRDARRAPACAVAHDQQSNLVHKSGIGVR